MAPLPRRRSVTRAGASSPGPRSCSVPFCVWEVGAGLGGTAAAARVETEHGQGQAVPGWGESERTHRGRAARDGERAGTVEKTGRELDARRCRQAIRMGFSGGLKTGKGLIPTLWSLRLAACFGAFLPQPGGLAWLLTARSSNVTTVLCLLYAANPSRVWLVSAANY